MAKSTARLRPYAWTLLLALGGASPAEAQDAAFQSFFTDACVNPSGGLAALCGETPGGGGDLSGDSESSLNPSQQLAAQEATLQRARERAQRVEGRVDERRAQDEDAPRVQTFGGLGAFLQGRGVWFERDSTGRERKWDGTAAGLQLGGDAEVADGVLVGLMFSWMHANANFDQDQPGVNFTPPPNDGKQVSDSYTFTLFGSWSITDALYVDGHVGGGFIDYDLKRRAVFQESTRTTPQTDIRTRSSTDGTEVTVGGRVGYDLALGAASIGPYARVQYTRTEIDGDTEKGGSGLAMRFPDKSRTSVTTALGASASYPLSFDFGVVAPQLRLEWEHEYERDAEVLYSSYPLDLGGNTFANRSDSPDRDYMNLGAGVAVVLPGGWMPYVDYQTLLFYRDWERHQLTGGIRKEF